MFAQRVCLAIVLLLSSETGAATQHMVYHQLELECGKTISINKDDTVLNWRGNHQNKPCMVTLKSEDDSDVILHELVTNQLSCSSSLIISDVAKTSVYRSPKCQDSAGVSQRLKLVRHSKSFQITITGSTTGSFTIYSNGADGDLNGRPLGKSKTSPKQPSTTTPTTATTPTTTPTTTATTTPTTKPTTATTTPKPMTTKTPQHKCSCLVKIEFQDGTTSYYDSIGSALPKPTMITPRIGYEACAHVSSQCSEYCRKASNEGLLQYGTKAMSLVSSSGDIKPVGDLICNARQDDIEPVANASVKLVAQVDTCSALQSVTVSVLDSDGPFCCYKGDQQPASFFHPMGNISKCRCLCYAGWRYRRATSGYYTLTDITATSHDISTPASSAECLVLRDGCVSGCNYKAKTLMDPKTKTRFGTMTRADEVCRHTGTNVFTPVELVIRSRFDVVDGTYKTLLDDRKPFGKEFCCAAGRKATCRLGDLFG